VEWPRPPIKPRTRRYAELARNTHAAAADRAQVPRRCTGFPETVMPDDVHVHQSPPPAGGNGGGSAGWLIALVVVVLLVIVIWFGFMRGGGQPTVPDQIDVNIDAPTQPQSPQQ
jgi:hypothetical protein